MREDTLKNKLKSFLLLFLSFSNSKSSKISKNLIEDIEKLSVIQNQSLGALLRSNGQIVSKIETFERNISTKHSTLQTGKNVWLLKPTDLNCGRGIKIFNKWENFTMLLFNSFSELCENDNLLFTSENFFKSSEKKNENFSVKRPKTSEGKIKSRPKFNNKSYTDFVIQKYIEKPYLYCGRKFDIRVWVLISNDMSLYFFR